MLSSHRRSECRVKKPGRKTSLLKYKLAKIHFIPKEFILFTWQFEFLCVECQTAGGVHASEISSRRVPGAAEHRSLVRIKLCGDASVECAPDRDLPAARPRCDESAVGAEAAPRGVRGGTKAGVGKSLDGEEGAEVDDVAAPGEEEYTNFE